MNRCCMFVVLLSVLADTAYSDTNYRLNIPIKPKSYSIAITPYFNTGNSNAFSFDGEVYITFTTDSITKQIKLHSEDLEFVAANTTVMNGANVLPLNATNPLEFDKNYTFAFINLQNNLQVDVEYSLKVAYRGPIRDDLSGFYRNYYIEKGEKRWLGATQMEPVHARKVFPCFDEPHLKATFTLTINRPESYKPSLANTKLQQSLPLSNGYVREIFTTTPVMSTYLVAFLISEFDGVEVTLNGTTIYNTTKEFGVFSRPEAVNQTEYPLDFGARVVEALGDYFGIDYYSTNANLKLDHIALPDFRAGAMENWGLIDYRESLLLFVPEHSTPYFKYRVAQIVAHETTHMWFGNLVTCHWWSNTWLNEGFANYFQDYMTSLIEPEVGSGNALVTGSVYAAYEADDDPTANPISNENVNSPAEISGHFGTITYQKAGSVIRMMHHLLGDEAFRLGLNSYLEANKFNSGYPNKLYEALSIGAQQVNALAAYPETNIEEVMSSWITQAGHPVLYVEIDYENDTVTLTQKRYYINSTHSSNELYKIPITYTTQRSMDFNNTKPAFVMHNRTHQFTIANINRDHSWVIFNIQETGLYRVNYDDHSWQMISSVLKGADWEKIHHLNRAKIVNDLFALLHADEVSFSRLVDGLGFLEKETDYSVWYATIRGFNKIWNMYLGSDALADIQTFALKTLENAISKFEFAVKPTDDFDTLRNRMQVFQFACKLGHKDCIERAVEYYKLLKDQGVEVPPSLRPVAYCNGLRFGEASDYDFLWNRMKTTNVASEASVIAEALGCTSDESRLRSYLHSMLEENSPIKTQDLTVPLSSVLSNYSHLHIVMDDLEENYTIWSRTHSSMDSVLAAVATVLHTEEDFAKFEAFLASCTECTEQAKTAARKSLEQATQNTAWAESHKEDILNSLKSSALVLAPSMMLIVGVVVVLFEDIFLLGL